MLDEVEIGKIKKQIDQGKTNYKIGRELRLSPNTVKKIREEYKDAETSHTTEMETHFDKPIEGTQDILRSMDNLIKNGKLQAGEKKKWEKRVEVIQELLRIEVYDMIPSIRSDAIEDRDEEYNKHIKENYVKKEVVTKLNNTIRVREATIENLNNSIRKKDSIKQ